MIQVCNLYCYIKIQPPDSLKPEWGCLQNLRNHLRWCDFQRKKKKRKASPFNGKLPPTTTKKKGRKMFPWLRNNFACCCHFCSNDVHGQGSRSMLQYCVHIILWVIAYFGTYSSSEEKRLKFAINGTFETLKHNLSTFYETLFPEWFVMKFQHSMILGDFKK